CFGLALGGQATRVLLGQTSRHQEEVVLRRGRVRPHRVRHRRAPWLSAGGWHPPRAAVGAAGAGAQQRPPAGGRPAGRLASGAGPRGGDAVRAGHLPAPTAGSPGRR
ncbi:unnamed protein product, partial [Prorocentrum cordatum]